jgi:hypothetical protein
MLPRLLALCALTGSFTSCVTPPTKAELDAADVGERPDDATAQQAARWIMSRWLNDPQTALFEFPAPMARGYYNGAARNKAYAWALPMYVTDRTGFGGFGRKRLYEFYFFDDCAVAYGTSDSLWGTGSSMRFPEPIPLEPFRRGEEPTWIEFPTPEW